MKSNPPEARAATTLIRRRAVPQLRHKPSGAWKVSATYPKIAEVLSLVVVLYPCPKACQVCKFRDGGVCVLSSYLPREALPFVAHLIVSVRHTSICTAILC